METKNGKGKNPVGQDDSSMTKIKSGELTVAAKLGEQGAWRVEVREKERVLFAAFARAQATDERIFVRLGQKILCFDKPEAD